MAPDGGQRYNREDKPGPGINKNGSDATSAVVMRGAGKSAGIAAYSL
jgi:hypothetical protein